LATARHAEPVRPLLEALGEAGAAVGEATGELISLVPEPGADALTGLGGPEAAGRAEAAHLVAAGLQHAADAEPAPPERGGERAGPDRTAGQAGGRGERAAGEERRPALDGTRRAPPEPPAPLDPGPPEATPPGPGPGAPRQQLDVARKRRAAAAGLAELEP